MSYLNEFIFEGEKAVRTKYYGYYATESGRVISIKIKGGKGKMSYSKAREMAYKENKDGYYEVCLSNMENGRQKRIYRMVHKIVFETFKKDVPSNLTIDHINNNCKDNRLSNLQLLSREENSVKRNKD